MGSTNLITNFDGEVTQSVAYIPYGEVFVEERNGSWSTPYLFNAKELDEETGLYYYGARYLNPTVATWLSVDPKIFDYPGMSPYNYCAGNPVKMVDPDGREFDTSELTEDQTKTYEENIQAKRQESELFDKLYSELDKSDIVYKIKVGKTQNNVEGQFDSRDNSITFSSIENTDKTMTVAEEFFHAYQLSENKGKYDDGSFNYEFEAKVFTTAVGCEFLGYGDIGGMKEFQVRIRNEEFGNGEKYLSFDKISTQSFFDNYKEAANNYAKYNIDNKLGNSNYKKTTEVKPFSLLEISK